MKEKKVYLEGKEVENNEIILNGNGGVYGVEVEIWFLVILDKIKN